MSHLCERLRERLHCLIRGHRVSRAPAYAAILPDRPSDKELHYCETCGSPVWVTVPRAATGALTWPEETV